MAGEKSGAVEGKSAQKEADGTEEQKQETCAAGDFGVKSYLHQFYERAAVSNPHDFEELAALSKKRFRCTRFWWRISLWLGINMLVFGIVAILVGYLVPQRTIVESVYDNVEKIDHSAQQFNNNLELCKVVGLAIFSAGGLMLGAALLLPSFSAHCHEEHAMQPEVDIDFSLKMTEATAVQETVTEEEEPKSPTEKQVPATEKVKSVQPKRKSKEALMTSQDGTFTMAR